MPDRFHPLVAVLAVVVPLALVLGTVPAGAVGNGNGANGVSAASIVRGPDDVLLPVVGEFAGSTVVSSTLVFCTSSLSDSSSSLSAIKTSISR